MKLFCRVVATLFWLSLTCGLGTASQPKPADACPLDCVLKKMDSTAANFHSARAEVSRQQFERVIQEYDTPQTGVVYYRRDKDQAIEMKLELSKPDVTSVLFSNGELQMYKPKIDQLTVYHTGKNRAEYESYLVLGFGGSGQELVKSFDVTYVGAEAVDGVNTAKLQMIPKSDKVRGTFTRIFLWIDLDRGISTQQEFDQPDGNKLLVKYSAIQLNPSKMPDVFKIKTTSKTQVISPQG
jgi:outer membrane lipoprotein-sorting protein